MGEILPVQALCYIFYNYNLSSDLYCSSLYSINDIHKCLLLLQNIFHGAISLDQLYFSRPTESHCDHRSPVSGLYLCGSGAHPGNGNVMFTQGWASVADAGPTSNQPWANVSSLVGTAANIQLTSYSGILPA